MHKTEQYQSTASRAAPVVGLGTVVVLALVQFAAFVDRAVPSVLAAPLKASFALSDAQLGLLQGPAFAITYAVVMLAAGHWARRVDPFRLMAFCVVVWTIGGVIFALANTFPLLMAGRMMLGVGQAAFAPAALIVLGSPGVLMGRSKALSLFTSGSASGRSGALFLGGFILFMVGGQTVFGLEPWRSVSLLLVAPNALLVAGLLLLSRRTGGWPSEGASGLNDALGWMFGKGRAILSLFVVGSGCVLLVQALGAWMPSLLARAFDLSVAQAAVTAGGIVLVSAPAGHLTAGWVLARPGTRPARIIAGGLFLASAAVLGLNLAPSPAFGFAALCALVAGGGVAAAGSLITVQPQTPERLRGAVNALFLATTSIVGVGAGPWITGWLSDRQSDGGGLVSALTLVVVAVSVMVIPLALLGGSRWKSPAHSQNGTV